MQNRYLVIDDFYDDPDGLVELATQSIKGKDLPRGNYAGVMTTHPFLGDSIRDALSKLILEPVINSATNANGRIRFTLEGDPFKYHIHYDVDVKTKWAGVVYLSKDHPKVDGTIFWKHLRTGLESVPNTVEGFAKYGWKDFRDLRMFLKTEGMDESLWKKTITIPYKYNRLILFRPWMLHSPGPAFGNTLENCRKIQTLFLGS